MSNPIQNASQIQQGIDFIRAQTQPESITNEHVANVLEAMQKPRILRNLTDSVQTGQLQINTNGFPIEYPGNSVVIAIKSSNLEAEDVELIKGSNLSFTRWALGEPEYEAVAKDEIVGSGLQFGEYYQLGAANGQVLFGNNLGSLPAGTSLGKFTSNINLYLQKVNMGQELIKSNVNMKVTNNIGTDFPFRIVTQTQYFSTETILKDGNFYPFSFFNIWNYRYFYFYNDTTTPVVLTKTVKIEIFKNGQLQEWNQYGIGQTFYPNNWQWMGQAPGLQPDDNVEIVISEVV